jgi:hypothetical protein
MHRAAATSAPLRRFLEIDRDARLRRLTSSAGPVQPRVVAAIAG